MVSKSLKALTKKMLIPGLHHPESTLRLMWLVLLEQETRINKLEKKGVKK